MSEDGFGDNCVTVADLLQRNVGFAPQGFPGFGIAGLGGLRWVG
jgi:hypothetical protein